MLRTILGVDVGGSGIKAALVNTENGELVSERKRFETPHPATPQSVTAIIKNMAETFRYSGPIGVAFPAVIQQGVVQTATNIDKSWIGENAADIFSNETGMDISVLNDADAAGLAEVRFGYGRNINGVVLVITVGSGIGTAIFSQGILVPNTELGQVYYKDKIIEPWVSDKARKMKDLSWKKWGKRFDKYLHYIEKLFYPELIILGGGISKKFEKYSARLKRVETKVVPAHFQNHAGIIGSAMKCYERLNHCG
jgi:polyphosphate glucokinase